MSEIKKSEIVELLSENEEQTGLLKKADEVRRNFVGDEVHLRGLIEFSNFCRNNCHYCGIRKDNNLVKRYRLTPEEIFKTAKQAADMGFKTIVLQSGEDMWFDRQQMCSIIKKIKSLDVALTLSIGERSYDDYKAFRDAGADRYLMRIETTDQNLYHELDPNMSWQHRYDCLMQIKELGYELGSGIIVGLPHQTIDSIADDLLFLQKIKVDMAGIGPFIPHPQTPLKNAQGQNFDLSIRTMAVMRLLLPDINIPATTAMESLHPKGRILALQSGANVVMINVTTGDYRQLYELYPNKACINETPSHCRSCIGLKIISIGRSIGQGYGGHKI